METKSSGIENDPWDTISTTVIEIYQSLLSTYTSLIKKKQTNTKQTLYLLCQAVLAQAESHPLQGKCCWQAAVLR